VSASWEDDQATITADGLVGSLSLGILEGLLAKSATARRLATAVFSTRPKAHVN
jgi:hypothetical protein